MQALWTTIFYQPIYNALMFVMSTITFGDVGFAVIILTIFVKILLFPVARKSIKSQVVMKKLAPLLKKIKEDYPNKEEQSKKTFALYKEHGVNPFSGCLLVLIQLPIIFALYYAFLRGLGAHAVAGPLYSFVQMPASIHTMFLGVIDMNGHSVVLALLAGISQFAQGYLMNKKDKNEVQPIRDITKPSFQEQLTESMTTNMKYTLPVIITIVAWQVSAAVALYWVVSNLCTIAQEWYVKKTMK